ncbi:MAG: EamA family transporter [Acidobacteriota bacterium]|nr:EamA family transporter [Acidobacteriota bacterium]
MAAVATGMALFFVGGEAPQATAPNPRLGNLAALAAGLCWGLTLIGLRRLGRDAGSGSAPGAVAAGNLVACLVTLPLWGAPTAIATGDLLLLLYLGVFQIGLAYVFLTRAMRVLPALEASLLLLAEPVINPLWALLFQGEIPGSWSLLGGGVILTAVAVHSLSAGAASPGD